MLALAFSPSDVTTVSGCNFPDYQDDPKWLRTGNCASTHWNFKLPPCMVRTTGVLIFTFVSDEASNRDTSDKFEVFRDGQKVATWVNDACRPRCVHSVPWHETSRTLEVKSTSSNSVFDLHPYVTAVRYEQGALS
jgi:hypothetical protein